MHRALSSGHEIGQQGDSLRGRFVYFWDEGHPGTVIEMAHMTAEQESIFNKIRAASIGWNGEQPIRTQWPS